MANMCEFSLEILFSRQLWGMNQTLKPWVYRSDLGYNRKVKIMSVDLVIFCMMIVNHFSNNY